ncbi:amino acid kinase [Candidatus Methylocalor cossyra]|uniref:(5-(Aminomethyl)furan-3-yl)methyl phosphate kinase n=1 Tax=Candidatus Methylocalor cossyra TaxID=3108543 RepID=A0ABM9NKX0_9GAMM
MNFVSKKPGAIRWVVKLGGSLAESEVLSRWLDALAETTVVIVPGGGVFADGVRAAQARFGFDDRTAHAMAILAMRQYALMMAGFCPHLTLAADLGRLSAAARKAERAVLWLPDPKAVDEREVPASWEVTSDSIAAWLARRLRAERLLLVKAAPIAFRGAEFERLGSAGTVDAAFAAFAAKARFETWLCRREDYNRLDRGLENPDAAFTRVIAGA